MALVGGEPFMSLESKGGSMTVEEERDHYRQRFLSIKLVLKELQQQLVLYKTRCSGVDTVALMLKESKQEVMTLTKQRRALETAVANLQNRLSANGLSNSVSIEETELFVPGASKQTLDNLAKENARLRTLLKSHETQTSKKPSEDIHGMAALLEKLEGENKQLRLQLMEMEQLKLLVSSQFEGVVKRINDAHQVERQQLEQELSQNLQQVLSSRHNDSDYDIERMTKATQTVDLASSKVNEVRQALRVLSDHCIALDQSLENAQEEAKMEKIEKDNEISHNDKNSMVSRAAYMELEQKLNQIIQMNQRWQAYNENQEQQIHGLTARITELEQLNKEGEELQGTLNAKEMENQTLKHQIMNLTREINKFRLQPPVDISMIEILKQQIQVCTEDFNTERKDREHAVNKAKQLQDELNRMMSENEGLKKDVDNLQRVKHTPEVQYDKRDTQYWMRPQPMPFNTFAGGIPPDRLPFHSSSSSSGTSPSVGSSHSPVPSPVPMSFLSTSSAADRSSFYPSGSQDSTAGFRTLPRTGYRQQVSHASGQTSLPRARGPQDVQRSTASPVSMPALSNKSEGLAKPDLTCPKCSKEFADYQQSELINHINSCTE